MLLEYGRKLVVAALVSSGLALGTTAAHAATAQEMSSLVFWGANGDHADLVLEYGPSGVGQLKVTKFLVADANGAGVSQQLNSCGTPIKSGDTVTAHALNPGQYCFLRASRTPASVFGLSAVSDGTANAQNITKAVRVSLEIRDANENVLTHVEVQ